MKATFDAEVVKDQDGCYLLRLETGFGSPEVWGEKSAGRNSERESIASRCRNGSDDLRGEREAVGLDCL